MSANEPNANRPGYKETKVGWIPEEWESHHLGTILREKSPITYGIVQPGEYVKEGIRLIRSQDYASGWGDMNRIPNVTPEVDAPYRRSRVQTGDVLITVVGANIGKLAVVPKELNEANISRAVARIRLDKKKADPSFVFFYLQGGIQKLLYLAAVGGAQPVFNLKDIQVLQIPNPPLPEQEKIAEILSTCDQVTEKAADLIEAKKRQKRALMRQLLTGRKRLPGFAGEWEEVRLSDICKRITKAAEDPDGYPVLSITAGRGFVSQADKFSRVIAGKQVEKYVLLKRGEFAYNKGNSYRYPQGCVYRLSEYDEGLVPNVFYSFKLRTKVADPEFIRQYFLAGLHNKDLHRWINSGVRNNGLLNLNASDFFKLPINLPPMDEQERIGKVLSDADEEIAALEQKLSALKQQKRSLMQKLLTGQVRVKV